MKLNFAIYKLTLLISAVLFCGLGTSSAYGEIVEGKSGIPAIDTLPVHEWDVETENKRLGTALLCGLFPGGMQYYFEHYTRGGFLTAIEGGLLFDILYTRPYIKEKRIKESREIQDSVRHYSEQLIRNPRSDSFYVWQSKRSEYLQVLRLKNDAKVAAEDLRKVETAWLVGLHLYGYMDGIGIWLHNQRRLTEPRSVTGAMLRAAALPGWGQIYNDEWGKAGLLYMAYIGAFVSYHSRQDMVEYFLNRKQIAVRENNTDEAAQLQEDVTFWRKRRNQFTWGAFLFYLYSVADAAVDASLSDFDNPLFLTFRKFDDELLPYAGIELRF